MESEDDFVDLQDETDEDDSDEEEDSEEDFAHKRSRRLLRAHNRDKSVMEDDEDFAHERSRMLLVEYDGKCWFDLLFHCFIPDILDTIFFANDFKTYKACFRVCKDWNKFLMSQHARSIAESRFPAELWAERNSSELAKLPMKEVNKMLREAGLSLTLNDRDHIMKKRAALRRKLKKQEIQG